MAVSPEWLAWLDGMVKEFNSHIALAGREDRYRRGCADYDGWLRSIPRRRRNLLCAGACAEFAAELARSPQAWVFLAGLQMATVELSAVDPEIAWREYEFPFSPAVVGDPVTWKHDVFQPRWLAGTMHALLVHREIIICPTTGFIILAGLPEVLRNPSKIRCLYEGRRSTSEWIGESLQWAVTPSIGFTLLPAAYSGAQVVSQRPAVLHAAYSELRRGRG